MLPGRTVTIKDPAAYGLILTQGYGNIGKHEVETPTLIRYGQMTKDELFVTAEAAEWPQDRKPQRRGESGHAEAFRSGESAGACAESMRLGGRSLIPFVLLGAACGSRPPVAEKPVAEKQKPIEYFHVDPAAAASVTGKVSFHGAKPPRKRIDMESDAGCKTAAYDEPIVTDKKGDLSNAFVYIQSGLEDKKFELTAGPVLLDQHGCMFVAACDRHPRRAGTRSKEQRWRIA